MHDIGVIAVNKGGRFGFKILAAGGLGHNPYHAITVEELVEEKDLLASMEAIITQHNKNSDRKRRARARIKFLTDKFGVEGFLEKYRDALARTKVAYADYDYPKGEWRVGFFVSVFLFFGVLCCENEQKQPGDNVVACPGTSTCRLGITSSKAIGARLSGGPLDLRIRASGCQNGCAQPETGDIGIYGEGKRLHGKLVPHYQMY